MSSAVIKSAHAVLDVTEGRSKLARRVESGERVRVQITGYIEGDGSIGQDDGTSIEFTVVVDSAREI